jgi:hypothetical protein
MDVKADWSKGNKMAMMIMIMMIIIKYYSNVHLFLMSRIAQYVE